MAKKKDDKVRPVSTNGYCPRCGVWMPWSEMQNHPPCNGKMIDPNSIK